MHNTLDYRSTDTRPAWRVQPGTRATDDSPRIIPVRTAATSRHAVIRRIAPTVANDPYVVVRGADMSAAETPTHTTQSQTVRSVSVATFTKTTSVFSLVTALFSLAITVLTGFNVIHPFVATLVAVASVLFFAMGRKLANQGRTNDVA